MKKEILIIVNPCAGKGKISKYIPDICDNLEKQGYEVDVAYTSKENNGKEIIKNYTRYIDTAIVCGGDGTLNEVINGAIEIYKKINITCIPLGTTNDFSKTLKIPTSKLKLSKKLSKYVRQDIDIGKFNDKYFYYVAAFGLFTDISYSTKQKEKNKYGRLAYFKEAFKQLKHIKKVKSHKTTIVTDNEIIKDEFIYGGISNSISIAGAKWFKRKDFSVNDGLFEVVLVKRPKNFIGSLNIMISILRKKYDQKNIYYLKSKHLKIDFEDEVTWTFDGEKGDTTKEVLIENKRKKVGMLVPKKSYKENKNAC